MKGLIVVTLTIVVMGIGLLFAADVDSSGPAQASASLPNDREPDLEVEFPVKLGYEGVQYRALVPGFEFLGAKLHPDVSKTRVMVALRFTARTVEKASIGVELLDNSGKVLYNTDHVEELGPEQVITKGTELGPHSEMEWRKGCLAGFPNRSRGGDRNASTHVSGTEQVLTPRYPVCASAQPGRYQDKDEHPEHKLGTQY